MAGKKLWIQAAVRKMKARGTLGKFGKATPSKIKAGLKAGGRQAKRALFARNVSRIAKRGVSRRGAR